MGVTLMAASDSLQKVSLHSFELIRMQNLWLNSSNPAALSQMDNLLPGILNANYKYEDGKYKRVQRGDQINQFSFNTLSYSKIKNVNVFGGFNYERSTEKGLNYSMVNDPFRLTPYQLVDVIGNDAYDREFFSAAGGISTSLNDKLTFGLAMDFRVGLSVQDRDPRPINKVFNMTVSPGIIYSMGKIKLGFNMLYKYYNEEIEVKIIREDTDAVFFSTHGLGLAISHEAKSINRLQMRNTGGFDFQLAYSGSKLKTLFGSRFLYYKETNGDGRKASDASWSSMKDDSKLKGIQFDFYNSTTITGEDNIQYFGGEFNLNTMTGIETIQHLERTDGTDMDNWVTYADEEKYEGKDLKIKINYEYLKLINETQRNFSLKGFVSYHDFSENYHIPMQTQSFKNLKMGVGVDKSFQDEKSIFTLGFGVDYKINLDGELNLSDYTILAKKILVPDYEFLTDDYLVLKFGFAFEIPMEKIFDRYFIKSTIETYPRTNGQSRTIFNISTGVTF